MYIHVPNLAASVSDVGTDGKVVKKKLGLFFCSQFMKILENYFVSFCCLFLAFLTRKTKNNYHSLIYIWYKKKKKIRIFVYSS